MAQEYEADKRSAALADRRTEGLIHPSILSVATVRQLLRSAYLQGLNDALEVACGSGK